MTLEASPPRDNVCQYSITSLQCFIIFPILKLMELVCDGPIAFPISFSIAILLGHYLIKFAAKANLITTVEHRPYTDHPHSFAISCGVAIRSGLLGILSYVGLSLIANNHHWTTINLQTLGFYLVLLSFFHFSEYFVTSITNPSTLTLGSFLINNSAAYNLAITCSFIEYAIEVHFFRADKSFNFIALVGLTLAIGGDIVRKLAMITAGRNFSHIISDRKDPNHRLVTHGIYSLLRHPSYAGWFYWAVGSQIMLQNPICTILFAAMSHRFFKQRINYEESILLDFFGTEYHAYKQRVGVWMPI